MTKAAVQFDPEIAEALAGKRILRVFRRDAPGRYHVEAGAHTWAVFRVRSEYGDLQWIIDRDDRPGYAQCATLDCVRATISSAVRDEQRDLVSHATKRDAKIVMIEGEPWRVERQRFWLPNTGGGTMDRAWNFVRVSDGRAMTSGDKARGLRIIAERIRNGIYAGPPQHRGKD